jgi:hypothetical protein
VIGAGAFCFWGLASGFWLLASGFWLLASGFWLLASGCWLNDWRMQDFYGGNYGK